MRPNLGSLANHDGPTKTMAIDTWDPRQYDKFQREREEYFATTLRNAREGKAVAYWR